MLTMSLFVQGYLHYSPLRAGVSLAPIALGLVVGSMVAFPFVARLGRRLLLAGLLVNGVGALGLALVVHQNGAGTGNLALFGPTFVIGVGMGWVVAPMFDVIVAGVSQEQAGSASGTLTAMQQVAGAVGVAGVTTIYLSLLKSHVVPDAMALSTGVVAVLILCACALVFLLPRQAGPAEGLGQEEHGGGQYHGDDETGAEVGGGGHRADQAGAHQ
jgi:MFS family permease